MQVNYRQHRIVTTQDTFSKTPAINYDIFSGSHHSAAGFSLLEPTEELVVEHAKRVVDRLLGNLPVFTPDDRVIRY